MDSGTITLSGSDIIVKFTGGESRGMTYRYQFVAFMTLPNGGAVLSLIHIGDTDPLRNPSSSIIRALTRRDTLPASAATNGHCVLQSHGSSSTRT